MGDDRSQAHDLAGKKPDNVRVMERLWLIEATKYGVPSMDDPVVQRLNAGIGVVFVSACRPRPTSQLQRAV